MDEIRFELEISKTPSPPKGFLFLCPIQDFKTGPSSFRWPDSPAYWALDPSGVLRLTTEDATSLGFPTIRPSMRISGFSWDASVYASLRECHEGKGFDPDGQDVARHLGLPLYRLSNEIDVPFAHINDEHTQDADDQNLIIADTRFETDSCENDMRPSTMVVDQDLEQSGLAEEIPVSGTFKFLMNVQLTLISFLALSGLYDHSMRIK